MGSVGHAFTQGWQPPGKRNGITNTMVNSAPDAASVMADAARFVGDAPMVAHNASFDSKFWQTEPACMQHDLRTR